MFIFWEIVISFEKIFFIPNMFFYLLVEQKKSFFVRQLKLKRKLSIFFEQKVFLINFILLKFYFGLYAVVGGVTTARPLSLLGGGLLKGVPGPPTNLEAVITSTRFLTLSWEHPADLDTEQITGYSVFYTQQGSERYILFFKVLPHPLSFS